MLSYERSQHFCLTQSQLWELMPVRMGNHQRILELSNVQNRLGINEVFWRYNVQRRSLNLFFCIAEKWVVEMVGAHNYAELDSFQNLPLNDSKFLKSEQKMGANGSLRESEDTIIVSGCFFEGYSELIQFIKVLLLKIGVIKFGFPGSVMSFN